MKHGILKTAAVILLAISAFAVIPVVPLALTEDSEQIYYYESSEASENGYAASYLVDENGKRVTLENIALENQTLESMLSTQSAEDYALPERYDAREYGYITSVKNQQGGTCWANAATACMETSYIKQGLTEIENPNFSEMHLAWSFYFQQTDNTDDPTYGDGSNRTDMPINLGADEQSAMSMLARWSGMANESDYPQKASVYATRQYYINNMTYDDRYASVVHLENYVELPNSVYEIKQAIIDNGAVCVSYSSAGKNYPYYYPEGDIDHSILVVGWNDNVSIEEFSESCRPTRNGAWLCKNSWGTSHGDKGYFYMSYDQTQLSRFFYYSADADFYDNNYQYCGTLPSFYELKSSGSVGSANVFTAKGNEWLEAVGAYMPIRDTDYTIEIYKNLPSDYSDPVTGGTLAATVSGTKEHSGYYTIELDEPVSLAEGEIFSVVLKTSASWTKSRFIAIGSKYYEHYESGRGYIYRSTQWDDAATAAQNDVFLRAFTTNQPAESFAVNFVSCSAETVLSAVSDENGCVELPAAPEGYAYEFTVNGAPFDGKNITEETTVTVHKYMPDDTVSSKKDICRLECHCDICGIKLWDTSSHNLEKTVINDFGCRRTESLCTVCGYYKTDFEFPPNTKNGIITDHAAWYISSGTLYIVGRGELAVSGSSTVTQVEGWSDELLNILHCKISDEITALPKGFLSGASNLVDVEIPEGITQILSNSFASASKLKTVSLPSTLKSIGTNAFSSTAITSLHIPESVETIGDGAFSSSFYLEELTGLEGIKKIGARAFSGSLISGTVNLPATLTYFGYGAFSNTKNLTDVKIHSDCAAYKSENGYILTADGTELLYYSSKNSSTVFLVPESVKTIGDYAFDKDTTLRYIDMPNVTKIGTSAFQGSALIGAGFGTTENIVISSYAFRNALSLKALYLPSNVTFVASFSVGYSSENKVLSDFTLYCESGSTAATYAKSAKISYVTDHVHEFERAPIVAATCLNTGISYMYCAQCGCVDNAFEVYSVTHSYQTVYDREPTCLSDGVSHGICIYCGERGNENTVEPATGHSFEWITDVEAACETEGLQHEECISCGLVQSENTVIEKTGHDFEWIVDEKNGCGWDGVKHEECKTCGFIQSEGTVIPMNNCHPWFRDGYACQEDGTYYGSKCTDCNYINNNGTKRKVSSSVHYNTTLSNIVEPTCTEAGTARYVCSYCGIAVDDVIYTVAAHHTYEYVIETAPTCVDTGLKRQQCTVCGIKTDSTQSVAATKIHTYAWVTDTDSDCVNEGIQHQECVNCGITTSETKTIAAKGHTYEWITDRAASCYEVGIMHQRCKVCGVTASENTEIALTAHSYEWITDAEPTCGFTGIMHQQCKICSAVTSENTLIAATGSHCYEWVIDDAGNCLTSGRKHQYCAACDSVASRNTVITPRGSHEFEVVYEKQPSCTENGGKRTACIYCDETESEETYPALRHSYGEWSEDTKSASGKLESERLCSRCGYIQHRNYNPGNVIYLEDFIAMLIKSFSEFLKKLFGMI